MKKSIAITFLFMFMLAIASPVMAMDTVQEPVKKECAEKKECTKEKKAECTKEKKAECEKKCSEAKK